MKQSTVRDIDGTVYDVLWSEDERSAEVSAHGLPVCIIYLSKRKGSSVWHNTGLIESYRSPELAVLGYIANNRRAMRRAVGPVEPVRPPVQQKQPPAKKMDWRSFVDAPDKPRENKWHHRKDFDD